MWVQLANIISDQSKHRYGSLIYLHPGLSDHLAVMSQLSLQKPQPPKVIITTRNIIDNIKFIGNIKFIDVDVFRNDLVVLFSDFDMTSTDLDSCVQI